MEDFNFYLGLGWEHIMSWDALDHLLFIAVLTAIYLFKDWKQLLILVTAFTIGHSLTLALSVLDIIRVNSDWVEFLIPCTIFFNCYLQPLSYQIHCAFSADQLLTGIIFRADTWFGIC